jgi:TolB-like protein/Tfp pilus assembly protein PilF
MAEHEGLEGRQTEASLATEATLDAASARDVFVSYASQDSELANAVVLALERNGLSCWIAPRDVFPGDLYADGIIRAITGSKVFVLLLSQNAIASGHVGKEVERASSKRRPIVALRTDTTPLTPALEYFLSESQWIELRAGQSDAALIRVVDAVRRHRGAETPKGSADRQPSSAQMPRRLWIPVLVFVVLVVAVFATYIVVDRFRGSTLKDQDKAAAASVALAPSLTPATPIISEQSVAVLPFVDMSEKKDQEYFSDGLSEELIDMLTKISDLRVPARTSSFYFKGKSEDIPTIAKRLLVAHVLEGSVRKSGNHMRITVQLVRADTGYHLWSQTYDRQVDDIFKVQDEIAAAVVKALKISLLEIVARPPQESANTEAYLLYMKGIALFRSFTSANTTASIRSLRESLKLDPSYAPAWSMLARVLRNSYLLEQDSYSNLSPRIRDAAERSVKLDPQLPDAYTALAAADLVDWRWDEAEVALKQALAIEPNNALALKFSSFLASSRGQNELALRYAEAALLRDPFDGFIISTITTVNMDLDRYAAAEAAFRKNLELNPDQTQTSFYSLRAFFKYKKGDLAGALAEVNQEPDETSRLYWRIRYLDSLGRRSEADADFAVLTKNAASDPFLIATVYARRGDADHAFDWLERAYQRHDDNLTELKNSLSFGALHADPRYKAMLHKMKLPE